MDESKRQDTREWYSVEVDENFRVLDGHGRLVAARRAGANPFGDWSFVRTPHGDYFLKPAASKCFAVMVLLESRGLPLHGPFILKEAGLSEDRRLDHVFRDSGAWGNLVRSLGRKSRRYEIVWGDDKTDGREDRTRDV